jgi:hypothetical protein
MSAKELNEEDVILVEKYTDLVSELMFTANDFAELSTNLKKDILSSMLTVNNIIRLESKK